MALRDTTRRIISLVESISGYPVLVTEDASLQTLATVKIARGSAAAHVIVYNPSAATAPDYLICCQCGFIVRLFTNPPAERFDLAGSPQARELVGQLLGGPQGVARRMNLDPEAIRGLRDRLFSGLMLQLRSMPVGLRVDAWIRQNYPELSDLQRTAILRQLQDSLATLGPEVRKIAPTKVYNASVTMNAAFTLFWSRTWDDPALSVPYKAAGYDKPGARLLSIFEDISDEPTADRRLIDAWADELGLSNWYEWVPYSARSDG
jgi:hypothetical protein